MSSQPAVSAPPAAAAAEVPTAVPPVDSQFIVPDPDGSGQDGDSAVNLSVVSSSTSITSSIMKYRQENGRTYHAYKAGTYILPNDDPENDRLDLQHHMFQITYDGKLFLCPAGRDKQVHRVLDAGTGTGIWALDYADEHPEAHVTGVDLSPIQPKFVSPNVTFFIDDVEEDWTYTQNFDFIYGRMLTGSIADWPKLIKQSYSFLNPGGWLELADLSTPTSCDDGTLPEDAALRRWYGYMSQASEKLGRSLSSAYKYKALLEEAGFINVTQVVFKWPQNTWPKDKKHKELGMWMSENMLTDLSGISLALFTRGLGWNPKELEVLLVDVRKEIKDRSKHAYWPLYVVYGQKPE